MVKRVADAVLVALVLGFAAFGTRPALAQAALIPTQIVVGGPAMPDLGSVATVQAVLADMQGHPISKETIYFTTQTKFLSSTDNVVLGQGMTDAHGQAVVHFTYDFAGSIVLRAEFRGDAQYAPCTVTIQIGTNGAQQVYSEHIGVDLPGFNVPPAGIPMASTQTQQTGLDGFIQKFWPAMNGWPVAAALLLVWSMYFLAMTFVIRLASTGYERSEPSDLDARRSP
ncbi:MAG: Ig-like domain-containing protein [Anaerolineae bacterium]